MAGGSTWPGSALPGLQATRGRTDKAIVFRARTILMVLPTAWDPIVRRSMVLICLVIAIGTGGYSLIEGWTFWPSLFFTLVTLTTVGYGDYGLSDAGERFTAVLMIGGIGTVSYMASQILQRVLTRAVQPERIMCDKAMSMRNHFVVCGLGRTGLRVIERLAADGAPVVAIDCDERRVEHARNRGIVAIVGDATTDESLNAASIRHAAGLAAVTSVDASNAMICLTAHAIAADITIIARAEDEASICKLMRAGANQVVSPVSYGGDGIAQSMLRPEVARLLPGLQGGDEALNFAEVSITENSPHRGRTIRQLGESLPRLVIIAVRGADGVFVMRPTSSRTLTTGDVLVVAGDSADMTTLRQQSTRTAA